MCTSFLYPFIYSRSQFCFFHTLGNVTSVGMVMVLQISSQECVFYIVLLIFLEETKLLYILVPCFCIGCNPQSINSMQVFLFSKNTINTCYLLSLKITLVLDVKWWYLIALSHSSLVLRTFSADVHYLCLWRTVDSHHLFLF